MLFNTSRDVSACFLKAKTKAAERQMAIGDFMFFGALWDCPDLEALQGLEKIYGIWTLCFSVLAWFYLILTRHEATL